MSQITRRTLLAAPVAAWGAPAASGTRLRLETEAAPLAALALTELERGLRTLWPGLAIKAGGEAAPGETVMRLRVDASGKGHVDAYEIRAAQGEVVIEAATPRALCYAVFDLLERNGAVHGIDGPVYPLDEAGEMKLPPPGQIWKGAPRFAVRGLLPWPDFLNCISVYNEEDFRAYFESILRMRGNTFGMHVYTGATQWAESYLSYEFAGAGHLSFLDNSASHRWGYLPQRTSTFGMGGAQYFDSETFGADATRLARDPWEQAERTRTLLARSLAYAKRLGLAVGVGFEPYQIPDEIWRALPPEVKPRELPGRRTSGARFDIESRTARRMLETRLGQLLEAYPQIDHLWLWEDENMNWESRRTGIPLSVTPFLQAHAFLKKNAPKVRLVVGGWGGVARHFDDFHRRLPGDVVFSCLSDSLGWDPVHDVFGRLGDRERWPIPWLEDDPAMWLPQFHAHRFKRDVDLSERYGCQGMLGIHWRHRIVDPTAAFFARAMWDRGLTPEAWYRAYAATQAAGPRASRLAAVLDDADRNRKLLATGTHAVKDGHVVTHEFSGDYNEAFTFWNNYEPELAVKATQTEVHEALQQLRKAAATAPERERVQHVAGHVAFAVPYAEAWTLAHRIDLVLKRAAKLKEERRADDAKDVVRMEALPLWKQMAPEVRRAVLAFQRTVATRNDLGTLASIQNKFVRLALKRLPLSLGEYIGDAALELEKIAAETMAPEAGEEARLIVPTRPTMLAAGESVRVQAIVVGGPAPAAPLLETRAAGAAKWTPLAMKNTGRRTYAAILGPVSALTEVRVSGGGLTSESWWVSQFNRSEAPARQLRPAEGDRTHRAPGL